MGWKGKPDKVWVGITQGHSHWEAKVIRGHSECYGNHLHMVKFTDDGLWFV